MDLTLLRSFLSIADCQAITEAADRIGLSQPALTRRVQQLEDYFATPLLQRSRKGIELTPLGRLVAAEARVLVSRYDNLRKQVRAHLQLESGVVRIGGGATAVSFLLPDVIAVFQQEFPAIRFNLKEAGSAEIAADVLSGQLELGLVTLPLQTRDLAVYEIMQDPIVLVARADHRLVQQSNVRANDLSAYAFVAFEAGSAIRQLIDARLRALDVTLNIVMQLRSIPAILRMVNTTGNLAFVSKLSLKDQSELVEVRVKKLSIKRKMAIIHRQNMVLSPAAQVFVERLRTLPKWS